MKNNFSCISVFCDDIRPEINGKISLMGIYTGDMYVPDFPITLPKICSFFELHVDPDSNSPEAIITVMKGSEKVNSLTLTLPSQPRPESRHGKPYAFKHTSGGMEFPSMTFDEPTLLEVSVQIDGQSLIAGRLWVTKFPQDNKVNLKDNK